MESRANSLRAYAENLLESDNTTLADEEVSGLVDDLIEFADQWEAELNNSEQPDSAAVEPYKWFNPDAINSVISHASKFTKGAEDLYAAWGVPLYLHPPIKPKRTLLAKLNEHREPAYKAQAEALLDSMQDIYKGLVKGVFDSDEEERLMLIAKSAIAKAIASTDSETGAAGILIRPQVKLE